MSNAPAPPPRPSGINRKMATGMLWMSVLRIAIKSLGLVSTVVLARLLVPEDFGVVAMATSVIAGMELFKAFNFDVALIQNQQADRAAYDTAWTLDVLLGTALALLLLLAAVPAAHYYSEPRLTQVIPALALGTFISGFENIGVVAFRKDLTFHREFVLRIVQKICGLLIVLPLAFALRSYWALVIGMVGGNVLAVIASYYAHPFRPRFSLAARHELLSFSKWLMANNVLWFLRDRMPDYLLGRLGGPGALGLFSISFEISNLPTSDLIAPINRAVLPAYAKMADDLSHLRQGFINVIALIALIALPAGLGIAATSELIVGVVLGPKWAAAASTISVLAAYGAINALQTNCGAVHYAMGRPRLVTLIGAVQAVVLLPALAWGAYSAGAIGIAWAYLLVTAIVVPANYCIVALRIHLRWRAMLDVLWRPMIASAAMYWVTRSWVAISPESSAAHLLTTVALGTASYVATLAALWLCSGRPAGAERTLVDKFVLRTWTRIRRGSATLS